MNLKDLTAVEHIVVHCADTPAIMDVGAKEIDQWHREKGWLCIGYHYVIRRNGTLEVGRPETKMGAHVKGHNSTSIGICLVGGRGPEGEPENNFTIAQMNTLRQLLESLEESYPDAQLVGHRDLAPGRACPCFDVQTELGSPL